MPVERRRAGSPGIETSNDSAGGQTVAGRLQIGFPGPAVEECLSLRAGSGMFVSTAFRRERNSGSQSRRRRPSGAHSTSMPTARWAQTRIWPDPASARLNCSPRRLGESTKTGFPHRIELTSLGCSARYRPSRPRSNRRDIPSVVLEAGVSSQLLVRRQPAFYFAGVRPGHCQCGAHVHLGSVATCYALRGLQATHQYKGARPTRSIASPSSGPATLRLPRSAACCDFRGW
jgi:hypothetical protein